MPPGRPSKNLPGARSAKPHSYNQEVMQGGGPLPLRNGQVELLQLLHRDRDPLPAAPRLAPDALHPRLGPDRDLARGRRPARSRPPRHRRRLRQARRPAAPHRRRRQRKVNGLAWCAQAVLEAAEQAREAAIGAAPATTEPREIRLRAARIARYLERNAALLDAAAPALPHPPAPPPAHRHRLRELAAAARLPEPSRSKTLDRTLTVLEEKLVAALLTATPEAELAALRAQADRELAPYRGKMQAVQIKQVQQQFLQKAPARSPRAPPPQPLLHAPRSKLTAHDATDSCTQLEDLTNLRNSPQHPQRLPKAPRRPARTSAPAADASSSTSPTQPSSTARPRASATCSSAAGLSLLPELQLHSSPPLGYRNRIRLTLAEVSGQLRAGYISTARAGDATRSTPPTPGQPSNRHPPLPSLLPPHHAVPHRRAHPLAHGRSPPRRLPSNADSLWLATRALLPRPARALHHRRRVAAPAHPLPPHRRQASARPHSTTAFTALCESLRDAIPALTGAGIFLLPPAPASAAAAPKPPAPAQPGAPPACTTPSPPAATATSNQPSLLGSRAAPSSRSTASSSPNSSRSSPPAAPAPSPGTSTPASASSPAPSPRIHPGHRRRDRRARRHRPRRDQAPQPPRRQSHHRSTSSAPPSSSATAPTSSSSTRRAPAPAARSATCSAASPHPR